MKCSPASFPEACIEALAEGYDSEAGRTPWLKSVYLAWPPSVWYDGMACRRRCRGGTVAQKCIFLNVCIDNRRSILCLQDCWTVVVCLRMGRWKATGRDAGRTL